MMVVAGSWFDCFGPGPASSWLVLELWIVPSWEVSDLPFSLGVVEIAGIGRSASSIEKMSSSLSPPYPSSSKYSRLLLCPVFTSH